MKFNVTYIDNASDSAVTAEYLNGTKRSEIDSVFIIDAGREATEAEIQALCNGTWQGI
jgi:hypothetical protein